jgi:hypothetical protein
VIVDAEGMPVELRQTAGTPGAGNASRTDTRSEAGASPPASCSPVRPSVGRVADILEAWRIDDEWWRTPIVRRYFDVVLEGGAHVVLFEDLYTEAWFVQQP